MPAPGAARHDPVDGRRRDDSYQTWDDPLATEHASPWLDAMTVTAVSAAEWRCSARWSVPRRVLTTANWCYYHRGSARLRLDGRTVAIRAGDFVLLPPGLAHAVEHDPQDPVHGSSGHFHAVAFGGVDVIGLLGFPLRVRCRGGERDPLALAACDLAREFALRAPGYQTAADARVRLMLLQLARHHGSAFAPLPRVARHAEAARLGAAFAVIDERLGDEGLTIAEVGAAVGVGEVRLRRLFRRTLGMAPVAYLRRRRIARACELLRQRGATVEAIGREVGYPDPGFFHRTFRVLTGMTPGAYRADPGHAAHAQ